MWLALCAAAFLRGAPADQSNSPMQAAPVVPYWKPGEPQIHGPCTVDPCLGVDCCCWSTHAADEHPAYPNSEVVNRERDCLNAPPGFVLVKEPGYIGNSGQYAELAVLGRPQYTDRHLCCTVREIDRVTIAGRLFPVDRVTAAALPPVPTASPWGPEGPPPVASVPVAAATAAATTVAAASTAAPPDAPIIDIVPPMNVTHPDVDFMPASPFSVNDTIPADVLDELVNATGNVTANATAPTLESLGFPASPTAPPCADSANVTGPAGWQAAAGRAGWQPPQTATAPAPPPTNLADANVPSSALIPPLQQPLMPASETQANGSLASLVRRVARDVR